jgi:uncharacterized protein (TIGR03382 family)
MEKSFSAPFVQEREMKNRANLALVAAAGSLALTAASASAGVILTYGFTELDGSYVAADANNGVFTATAVNNANLATEGDVTRLLPPGDGTAAYDHGFFGSAFGGAGSITMTVARSGTAGTGTYTVTDFNGDTLTGTLSGDWIFLGGATFFNGVIDGVFSNGGGQFNGASVAPTSFTSIMGPMDGGVTILFTNNNADFFGSSFTGVSTLVQANYVPTPGAMALVGLGGLVAVRRRR